MYRKLPQTSSNRSSSYNSNWTFHKNIGIQCSSDGLLFVIRWSDENEQSIDLKELRNKTDIIDLNYFQTLKGKCDNCKYSVQQSSQIQFCTRQILEPYINVRMCKRARLKLSCFWQTHWSGIKFVVNILRID